MRRPLNNQRRTSLPALYIAAFVFSLHLALPLYIISSFLGSFFPEKLIGFLYAISSVITLFVLLFFPKILRTAGNYKTMLTLLIFEAGALVGLSYAATPQAVMVFFLIQQLSITLIYFNFDVFLEVFSSERTTGRVRGLMLTSINLAILIGPLLAGFILSNGDFWRIYLTAAALLIPVFFIIAEKFKGFQDPHYEHIPVLRAFKNVLFSRHPKDDLRHIVLSNFLMRVFFSWMVIYTPIYLHSHIGFSWGEIGIIFTFMLLPFVLFEAFIGRLTDSRKQEKKIMAVGFIITAFFTGALSFVTVPSLIIWAVLLFGTRVGMSFVEITSESYFFKRIESNDTHLLSVFRNNRPLSYIIGPLLASVFLLILPIQFLFLALALIMLYGAWNSIRVVRSLKLR